MSYTIHGVFTPKKHGDIQRNPQNGEVVTVAAHKAVVFKAAKAFKESCKK